jgi:sucrose-6-phosphate hydrolase SacC (GH32 family)
MSRLPFLFFASLLTLIATLSIRVRATGDSDPYFPAYHVRPSRNWINDPNGPFRDPKTNLVHLWMQYNPDAAVWGNMSWWHAVTTDYVHWQPIGISLTNDNHYDAGGVFSGSVSLSQQGDPVIFYTCVGSDGVERQCIATPTNRNEDVYLVNWTKSSLNPIIDSIPQQNGGGLFRDPTTGWLNSAATGDLSERFYFAAGISVFAEPDATVPTAKVALFETSDISTITQGFNFSGKFLFGDPYELSNMFECPDFFTFAKEDGRSPAALDNGVAVVKASSMTTRHDYFYIGVYNATTMDVQQTTTPVAVDYGCWYASKSFWDSTLQQRVLFGWIGEEDGNFTERGWAGVQSIPRVVVYDDAFLTVRTYPLPQLEGLRDMATTTINVPIPIPNGTCVTLQSSSLGTGVAQHEIKATFIVPLNAPFHVELRVLQYNNGESFASVSVDRNMPGGGATWNNTDQPGGDYKDYPLPGVDAASDIANCSASCEADRRCVAWTYVRAGYPAPSPPFHYAPRCSMKGTLPSTLHDSSPCCVSGRPQSAWISLNRDHSGTTGATVPWQGRAVILPDPFDSAQGMIRLHLFVDHSVVEAFMDDGLERVSGRVYIPAVSAASANGVAACGTSAQNASVNVQDVVVWPLRSIW